MSRIQLQYAHELGRRKAVGRINDFLEDIARRYEFDRQWEGDVLCVSRSGVTGEMRVRDDLVEIDVKLGLVLSPLRQKIAAHIVSNLDRLFAESPGRGDAG
jgi:putative polyhydroxyalkanoate system protein